MKKLMLFTLMILLIAIISINAFAENSTDITVGKGDEPLVEDSIDVMYSKFTNYGTVYVKSAFSACASTVFNSGDFTVNGDFIITGPEGDNSEFTNNGTLRIGSASNKCVFRVDAGTTFTNSGVVYLSNIEVYDLSGTVSGDGYFVCDDTVNPSMVEELKSVSYDKVLTTDEYQELMGENGSSASSKSADVKADYQPGTAESTVYSVDITWGSLEFTYTDSSKGVWNPNTHKYDGAEEAKWSWADGANEITVTNHSNAAVTATASYTAALGYELINMTFDKASLDLATADNGVNGAAGTPTSATISVTPNGALKKSESRVVIGSITITIN